MSTNKNAYEIRADILSQAQGLLHSKYEREMSIWEQTRTRDPVSYTHLTLPTIAIV